MNKRPTLSPRDAAWLARTMDRNRSMFGGYSMEADPNVKPGDKPAPAEKPDDGSLGDAGKKAIDAERDARKKAEADLTTLRKEFDGFRTSLTEALGVKPDKGADDSAALKQVQDSLTQIQHENTVLALANEHGIKDAADLAILHGSNVDATGLAALATRLAPSGDDGKPGTPKPDNSQGAKGDKSKPDSLPGVPRMAAALDEAMSNTN